MKTSYQNLVLLLMATIISIATNAQSSTTISGTVRNSLKSETISAVSVLLKGSTSGTFTDDRGRFEITSSLNLPITLIFSSIGFGTKEVVVTNATSDLSVVLDPSIAIGQEVVVSASRVAERILESPVTVERVNAKTIANAPSPSYYDVIGNLKGVDLTTSSFAFKTPSTRGFNGSGNLRFNQIVDGMDNQAPALNFAVGSIIGLTELDVESMELLPGASSALYGSGGMNGTLLINSKNPFKYQGFSMQIKQGVNHIDNYQRSAAPYYDYSLRFAKKLSEKFAFKIGAQYIKARDWQANDERNLLRNNVISSLKGGDRTTDLNYDGVNVFGDEASANMQALAQAARAQFIAGGGAPVAAGVDASLAAGLTPQQIAANPAFAPFGQFLPFLIPTSPSANATIRSTYLGQFPVISRTGYQEKELVDYNTYNARFTLGLNYKITNDVEASFLGYYGTGTAVYTGADRYALKNLKMGQYKLEVKGHNWFVRGYTTQENSGDSYTATTAALFINNSWKPNATWFQQYTGTYGAGRLGILPGGGGVALPEAQAHGIARGQAETGRILPGTPAFNEAFKNAIDKNISEGGAKFADKSNLYHYEGQYNFSEHVKFVDVLVGTSFRRFHLNSEGTIFADSTAPININEYGAYVQLQKRLFSDVLKLTGSIRYDKNENFKGRFTPRISALIKVAQDNNIRLSYQTAYRFPSTQDQYINLLTGGANRLIGGLPEFETFFKFNTSPAYTSESIVAYRTALNAGTANPTALLKVAPFSTIKPETMRSFELGYKALFAKKLLVDVYGYYSKYKDFIARAATGRGRSASTNPVTSFTELASPFTTDNYSFVVSSPTPVKAIGFGAGLEYNVYKSYVLTANGFSDRLQDVPAGLITFFNTPKYRFNVGAGNTDVYRGIGFNFNYRWQDEIDWEGTFGAGKVPSYGTLDAMLNYRLPKIKSMVKLGATNVFNKYYRSAFGNPQIGGLYYVSFGYNVF